jgi:hypothetical protein
VSVATLEPKVGSIYRIYSADGTSHSSAVCIDSTCGSILEVKNPNNPNKKTKYNTLEDWRLSHGPDAVVTADDFSSKDFEGFNAPESTKWTKWCLEMIGRGARHLLQNDEVKTAFNNHVALCTKYAKLVGYSGYYCTKDDADYWNPARLAWSSTKTDWNGKVIKDEWMSTSMEFFSNVMCKNDTNMTDGVRNELLTSYKTLYDLISPHVLPYLKKKYTDMQYKYASTRLKKRIATLEDQIATYKHSAAHCTKYLEKHRQELVNLEMKKTSIN